MTEAGVVYLTAAAACVYRDACDDDNDRGASLPNEWRKDALGMLDLYLTFANKCFA